MADHSTGSSNFRDWGGTGLHGNQKGLGGTNRHNNRLDHGPLSRGNFAGQLANARAISNDLHLHGILGNIELGGEPPERPCLDDRQHSWIATLQSRDCSRGGGGPGNMDVVGSKRAHHKMVGMGRSIGDHCTGGVVIHHGLAGQYPD